MITRIVLMAVILAVSAYGIYEIRTWSNDTDRSLVSHTQRRIRSIGLLLILTALALWIYGTYIPIPHVNGANTPPAVREAAKLYVGYWMFTLMMTVPLVPLAILDTRENLRRAADERKRIFRETILLIDDENETAK